MSRPLPLVTAVVLAGAMAAYASPALSAWLVYDRSLVLSGEVWRLLTGAWVHFSPGHLAWDAVAFGAAGVILEPDSRARLTVLCLLAAFAGGVVLFVAAPGIAQAGGLSGLAVAGLVAVAVRGLTGAAPGRVASLALLAVLAIKIAIEAGAATALVAGDLPPSVVPLGQVHLAGAAAALAIAVPLERARRTVASRSM